MKYFIRTTKRNRLKERKRKKKRKRERGVLLNDTVNCWAHIHCNRDELNMGETELYGHKPVSLPLCLSRISNGIKPGLPRWQPRD